MASARRLIPNWLPMCSENRWPSKRWWRCVCFKCRLRGHTFSVTLSDECGSGLLFGNRGWCVVFILNLCKREAGQDKHDMYWHRVILRGILVSAYPPPTDYLATSSPSLSITWRKVQFLLAQHISLCANFVCRQLFKNRYSTNWTTISSAAQRCAADPFWQLCRNWMGSRTRNIVLTRRLRLALCISGSFTRATPTLVTAYCFSIKWSISFSLFPFFVFQYDWMCTGSFDITIILGNKIQK